MNSSRTIAYVAFVAALFATPLHAEDVKAGDLVITQAWSRATPGGAKIGGGYLTIENKGSAPDRLFGGSADVAGDVQVHEMSLNNGVMTMRALDKGLAIEPGKTVKLAPGGYHLMLLDLKSPLKQGDKLPVTLDFEKAGKVKLTFDYGAKLSDPDKLFNAGLEGNQCRAIDFFEGDKVNGPALKKLVRAAIEFNQTKKKKKAPVKKATAKKKSKI